MLPPLLLPLRTLVGRSKKKITWTSDQIRLADLTAPPIRRLLSTRLRSHALHTLSMAGASLVPSQAGATPNRLKRKAPDSSDAATTSTSAGEDEAAAGEEEEIEELEREVADLGRRILEHRRDAAARFLDAAVSRLAAFRPTACPEAPSEEEYVSGEQDMLEKLEIFKSKAEASIEAMPKVLKKMNGCVARLEKLEQLSANVHPVFQRKR
uniref:Uncharacterized protein n=1 Tax=Avena sativa TaxID=4498 RepID=A0ACD5UU59_AVESA